MEFGQPQGRRLATLLLVSLAFISPDPLMAFQRVRVLGSNVAREEGSESVSFPSDRSLMQRLSKAQDLLKEERYAESVRLLGNILEHPEDAFFLPDGKETTYRSIKTEAERVLGQIPESGRESYELQYGTTARQLLEQAAATGDVAGLAEVSRRFFHTAAGYEATDLLGSCYMQDAQPLAAALCFQRLQQGSSTAAKFEPLLSIKLAICWSRAGMRTEAEETLMRLKERDPRARVRIAGQEHALFGAQDGALAWLTSIAKAQTQADVSGSDQWALHRGGPSRNAVSTGSSPLLSHRWAVPTSNDPHIEKAIDQVRMASIDEGVAMLPGWHPLAVQNYVFIRSFHGLVAIDFKTGKRVWHGPADESMRQLTESKNQGASLGIAALAAGWLNDQIWGNSAYGTMSSDGKSVFCLEDFGSANNMVPRDGRAVFFANGVFNNVSEEEPRNRLAAYDIATEGKLKWDLGSTSSKETTSSTGYFLGPPLPLDRRLYVLAEVKNEIRLLCLDADTGTLQWAQRLADTEVSINSDPIRRNAGAGPSFSDGVLVCPTSAGAVVAVDLTTRSLLWAYRYSRVNEPTENMMMRMQMRAMNGNMAEGTDHWADATATIAQGHVLLTPPESNEIHCLNLLDGKLLWKQPREDGLYVGCVHKDHVFVVGRSHVRNLQLDSGKATVTALPAGSMPSGRGFFNGTRYFLPLTTAEVAAIDIDNGNIVSRSKSRSGSVAGNLICYQGSVISQGVTSLESFYQLDDLQEQVKSTLARKPDDPTALALRGELFLNDGQTDLAVTQLKRSLELNPDPHTRELLTDALTEGLKIDFAKYRQSAEEIELLIERPEQRLGYLRQYAMGLQNAGEVVPAFEAYMKIAGLREGSDELERIDNSLSIRRSYWIRARMQELAALTKPEDAQKIEDLLRGRLQTAIKNGNTEGLREFIKYFGSHPLADEARETLVARIAGVAPPLEVEFLLRQLEQSSITPEQSRGVDARMAKLLVDLKRIDDAEPYLRRLGGPHAKLVCLDGKTGRELIAELLGEKGLQAVTEVTSHAWPVGNVESQDLKGRQNAAYRSVAIDTQAISEPFFKNTTIEFDQNNKQSIIGRDGLGRERWRVSLSERNDRNNFVNFTTNLHRANAEGHLLLANMGNQLLAIDTLGGAGTQGPRVLWREDLTEMLPGMSQHIGINRRQVIMAWGVPQFIAEDSLGRPLGNVGPVTPEVLCFQRQRTLIAIHPLTGETLWMRHGTQPGSDLFGDKDMVFITSPNSEDALVVSTLDGHELGHRTVPKLEQRLMVRGRCMLTWNNHRGNKKSLVYRDVWDNKVLWEKDFDAGARPWPMNHSAVGVLDRKGHFTIVSVPEGKTELEARIDPIPSLSNIVVFRTPNRDLLIASEPVKSGGGANFHPAPGGFGNPLINGALHGFDRQTGKLEFSTKVENYSLVANQPSLLPFLTFASQKYQTSGGGRQANTPETMMMCIDKRTGRVIYDDKSSGPIAGVELIGDPDKDEVMLRTIRSAVRLKLTDKPVKEKTEPKPDEEKKPEEKR